LFALQEWINTYKKSDKSAIFSPDVALPNSVLQVV
jgi:hypothetical protein